MVGGKLVAKDNTGDGAAADGIDEIEAHVAADQFHM